MEVIIITYGDLKREIFALGFETEGRYKESGNIIPFGINRAIRIINSEVRPLLGKVYINSKPLKNICDSDRDKYTGEDISFSGKNPLSYVFKCDGTGAAIIKDSDGIRDILLEGVNEYRGFCSGDTEIIFTGDFSYNIYDFAFYDELLSDEIKDIPSFGEDLTVNLKELCSDFIAFNNLLFKDSYGKERQIKSFRIENKYTLILPRENEGIYTLFYKKQLPFFTANTSEDTPLEIDEDLWVLIPLLASFYIWLDDDATKAAMYRNEYETIRNSLILEGKTSVARVWKGKYKCL